MGTTQEMFLDAHSIRKHKNGYKESSKDHDELDRRIDEESRRGVLYDKASQSIAPEIFGHADVKKALLLGLIGSFTKTMKDGMKIRGDIHCLLMGDPGVAKSQLLKQCINIAPRSVYTTGKGSSGVGLTASVVRDRLTGEVALEAGALVLADTGVCCIDEFDKMDENDRTAIHEVMEQQTVSIAKSGITTTLNCRTTILAAANPQWGRYNPRKSPVENMNMPPALLSRFDFTFLLLDTVDNDNDKKLALHVCKVHTSYNKSEEAGNVATAREEGDVLSLGFNPFPASLMRHFIRRAKTFEPLIEDSLQQTIVDAYVQMREEEKAGDIDSRKSYTTPRSLLAILRISQAHARARFSNLVQRQDFEEATRLMKASKESVELSAAKDKDKNPLDVVYDVIGDLTRRSGDKDGWVDLSSVVNMAGHKALGREQVVEAVDNWESLSVLVQNPEKTKVRFMVPSS
jgi:DNA replication licensing factor MCM7